MSTKEILLASKYWKLLTDPIGKYNPVTVLVLGICSTLAVTAKLQPAMVMAISVTIVVAASSTLISLLRRTIPNRIRIIVQLVVVASMVILVDQVLRAFVYSISKQLSVFVGLIITNCIVMGRIEAFALKNAPIPSFVDGVGNGIGYGLILVIMGAIRELLGLGTLWNYRIIPESWYAVNGGFYENNGLIILPPMALIIVGVIIWVQRSHNKSLIEPA
jgi:Na+-transporting NADH:ubiquinone oxidoreductase subunit D